MTKVFVRKREEVLKESSSGPLWASCVKFGPLFENMWETSDMGEGQACIGLRSDNGYFRSVPDLILIVRPSS